MTDGKITTGTTNKNEDNIKPHSLCHIIAYIHFFSVASQKNKRRQSKEKLWEVRER